MRQDSIARLEERAHEGELVAVAKEAHELASACPSPTDRARLHCLAGGCSARLGRAAEALAALRQAMDLPADAGTLRDTRLHLARVYATVGQFDIASRLAAQVWEEVRSSGFSAAPMDAAEARCRVALERGAWDDAASALSDARSACPSPPPDVEARLLLLESELHRGRGDRERAASALDALSALDPEELPRESQITINRERGLLLLACGGDDARQAAAALGPLQTALAGSEERSLDVESGRLHRALALAHEVLGGTAEALRHGARAIDLAGRISSGLPADLQAAYLHHPAWTSLVADIERIRARRERELAEGAAVRAIAGESSALIHLMRVAAKLGEERDPEVVLEMALDSILTLYPAERAYLLLMDGVEEPFVRAARGADRTKLSSEESGFSRTVARWVFDRREPLWSADAASDERLSGVASVASLGVRSIACFPLRAAGRVFGVACLENRRARIDLTPSDIEVMQAFVDQASVALESSRLYEEAVRDGLTGLYTHRYLTTSLEQHISRAVREGEKLGFLIMDLDRFKLVNDRYGHAVGNQLLLLATQIIRRCVRGGDTVVHRRGLASPSPGVVGRFGGDEFEVLLAPATRETLAQVGERIVAEAARARLKTGDIDLEVRMSVGGALYPDDASDAEALLRAADEALYEAKRGGRNRFVMRAASGPGEASDRTPEVRIPGEESLRSRDEIALLGMLGRILTAGLDPDTMLTLALDLMMGVTRAGRGFLLLRAADGELRTRLTRGPEGVPLGPEQDDHSRTLVRRVLETKKPLLVRDVTESPDLSRAKSVADLGLTSAIGVPIVAGEDVIGLVVIDSAARERRFTEEDLALLGAFARRIAQPIAMGLRSQAREEETRVLRRALAQALEEQGPRYSYDQIVGRGAAMRKVLADVDRIVDTDYPVVIEGESGTGKELIARAIHFNGRRRAHAFVAENCGAIPEALLESELFGHVRGAFTGANQDRRGLFAAADGGTLFLDEIGETSPGMQTKLLRALQEGEIRPVGARAPVRVNVRVLCASNRDLAKRVQEGAFREDLFYRLAVLRIQLPPLRERPEDIAELVERFLADGATQAGSARKRVSQRAMDLLRRYPWPGNVRELQNEVKRLLSHPTSVLDVEHLSEEVRTGTPRRAAPSDAPVEIALPPPVTRERILQALERVGWNCSRAAADLGIPRSTFYVRLAEFGIERPPRGG